jgi:hypothetical protein
VVIQVALVVGLPLLMKRWSMPNKSPEPTAVGAVSPLSRAAVSGRLWLSFHR